MTGNKESSTIRPRCGSHFLGEEQLGNTIKYHLHLYSTLQVLIQVKYYNRGKNPTPRERIERHWQIDPVCKKLSSTNDCLSSQIQSFAFIIERILARLLITRGGKMVLKAKENDIGKRYIT